MFRRVCRFLISLITKRSFRWDFKFIVGLLTGCNWIYDTKKVIYYFNNWLDSKRILAREYFNFYWNKWLRLVKKINLKIDWYYWETIWHHLLMIIPASMIYCHGFKVKIKSYHILNVLKIINGQLLN